jgi:hypothetical protein
MAFQAQNRTCEMKSDIPVEIYPENQNGSRFEMRWKLFCSVFWIGMKCFSHFGRNETKLTTYYNML